MVGLQKPPSRDGISPLKSLGTKPPFMSMANQYLSSRVNSTTGESPTRHCTLIYSKRSARLASMPFRFISTGYLTSSVQWVLPLLNHTQGFHSPNPDTFDFETSAHDLQPVFDAAKKAGLWVIARPGPYLHAKTTAGGFPGYFPSFTESNRPATNTSKAGLSTNL